MIPDLSHLNLRGLAAGAAPQGPALASDAALVSTGTVYAVAPYPVATVQVATRGGVVTLPATAARYTINGLARVLLDPVTARPLHVIGAVNPAPSTVLVGVYATGAGTVTVTYQGVSSTIPTASGTYTAGQSAWIMLDDWGVPVVAIGPSTTPAPGWSGGTPTQPPVTVTATATVGPQISGTWRDPYGWDQWNVGRYGDGSAPVYQGNQYGSGPLTGFVGYGAQVANLGALTITSITTTATKNADGNAANLIVQGTAAGTRPAGIPSPSGDTAQTGPIPSGGTGTLTFTANMCEAFRTGAAQGLAAIGGDYGGFPGFDAPPSFVLQITYTKNA